MAHLVNIVLPLLGSKQEKEGEWEKHRGRTKERKGRESP